MVEWRRGGGKGVGVGAREEAKESEMGWYSTINAPLRIYGYELKVLLLLLAISVVHIIPRR